MRGSARGSNSSKSRLPPKSPIPLWCLYKDGAILPCSSILWHWREKYYPPWGFENPATKKKFNSPCCFMKLLKLSNICLTRVSCIMTWKQTMGWCIKETRGNYIQSSSILAKVELRASKGISERWGWLPRTGSDSRQKGKHAKWHFFFWQNAWGSHLRKKFSFDVFGTNIQHDRSGYLKKAIGQWGFTWTD